MTAIFMHPNNGMPSDIEQCKKYLKYAKIYNVSKAEVGRSYTKVWLDGFDEPFNSVMFDFYKDGKETPITKCKEFWKYNYDGGAWL